MVRCPHKQRMFLEEGCKRASNDGEVFDELPVIADKAQETAKFFSVRRSRPVNDCADLRVVSGNSLRTDNVA
jgi:hypothetical protein